MMINKRVDLCRKVLVLSSESLEKFWKSYDVDEVDDVAEDGDVALELRHYPDDQLTEVWFDSLQVKEDRVDTAFCDHGKHYIFNSFFIDPIN
jgi:hypothetical protein